MPQPDDFTLTLLHHLQDERTTPQGGWLGLDELRSLMGLSSQEAKHLHGPLVELYDAGMIERRFDAPRARDEWRSRGVQPDMGQLREDIEAYDRDAESAPLPEDLPDPAPTTIFPALIKGRIHAGFVLDYRTDRWATMCGKMIKDPSTVEHRRMPVQCHQCAEALT